ncbi:RagB/SusD family nutrient uptake outer membrane protein [Petrimonas sp.]|uniref:RagB/SusD family nutrient uptake outer membrane protein n=1 Tax=Petrimonas sp. TaxID=2023866 RepID=UPI003F50F675
MKLLKISILSIGFICFLSACTMLEPENDNHSTSERLLSEPEFGEGLLIRAYTFIPTNSYRFDEVATDDAVTNDKASGFIRMATGEWSSRYDPQSLWTNANRAISYINEFLTIVDKIEWKATISERNGLYIRRLIGESYALRGLFKYYLIRNHAGVTSNGELLGAQLFDLFPIPQEEFSKPRATFRDYVNSAYADLDEALKYLPLDYGDIANLQNLPSGFSGITNLENYNAVFGNYSQQRVSGRHVNGMKARLALLEASPSFNATGEVSLWEKAANYNALLIDAVGGVGGLDPRGHIFYLKEQVDNADLNAGDRKDIPEMLWRRPISTSRSLEVNNFPPSLYGGGTINPSQNLVDAFPMVNGYPITHPSSGYVATNPYANRDPRLALYIIYDGSRYKNTTIRTGVGGGVNAVDSIDNSTRTGYYLKKLLREDVNANPSSPSDQKRFDTHIRYTEIFLNYAEAANEAWGPTGTGPNSFSAKDVVAAIRRRAGIRQPDNYLNSINDKETMRQLIQNERRLELCFEGFRFWDLRRWKKDLTEPVRGVHINRGTYSFFTVEERAYDNSYMIYGPIPNSEIVKFGITQNAGW